MNLLVPALYQACCPGGGTGFEPIAFAAFVLAFVSLGFATRRFSRRRRSWLLFVVLAALFAYVGMMLLTLVVM